MNAGPVAVTARNEIGPDVTEDGKGPCAVTGLAFDSIILALTFSFSFCRSGLALFLHRQTAGS